MPQGTAKDVGTIWWEIVDGGDNPLCRFDHQQFPYILDGATVTYVDADGDGIAEDVQPAAAVARYVGRVVLDDTSDDGRAAQVLGMVMAALREAGGTSGAERQKRLRRLRAKLDRLNADGHP